MKSHRRLNKLLRPEARKTQPDALFTDGAAYERLMGRWSRLVGAIFIDWLAVPPGLRWLDVGCGNGAFTELLIARRAPAGAVAVDPSADQLAYARTRPGAKIAEFHQGDAQALRFGNEGAGSLRPTTAAPSRRSED